MPNTLGTVVGTSEDLLAEIAFFAGFAAIGNAFLASVSGWLWQRVPVAKWVAVCAGLIVVTAWTVYATRTGEFSGTSSGVPAVWVPLVLAFVLPQALAVLFVARKRYVHALIAAGFGVVGALIYWIAIVPAYPG